MKFRTMHGAIHAYKITHLQRETAFHFFSSTLGIPIFAAADDFASLDDAAIAFALVLLAAADSSVAADITRINVKV
jgi:hypothetical protein